ncbi:uncharacterized protein LOC130238214 [Danio aesculapii]|uniref:uncharacterized protein LOC130238214 n=1 Tax=Danio aesculapii TaxID=1142201 RepID=UPI0024C0B7C3|nr:uncharacterized protein LOC130238214 [Danio aesculapii]
MSTHLYLILLMTSGVMSADKIGPNKDTNVISKEGETVTLSCSYDTQSSYVRLYWYRQYAKREPQYLIWKGARSLRGAGNSIDRRFQSTTSESSTKLTVTVTVTLSVSALYCALIFKKHDMEKQLMLILILTPGTIALLIHHSVMTADQIRPNKDSTVIKEEETVTLSCSYESSSTVWLYWYSQHLNGEPQFLVSSAQPSSGRFQIRESDSSTELTISSVSLSDSALYYCALRVRAQ